MPRIKRIVYPGLAHHILQRGNRRQKTFFRRKDYEDYLELLDYGSRKFGVRIWAYCLMPNHVHIVGVPDEKDSLSRCFSHVHRLYTARVNKEQDWVGFLWQGRFSSFPMESRHALNAIRYVEMNPVRAKMVSHPAAYEWSSAAEHANPKGSTLLSKCPLMDGIENWERFLGFKNLQSQKSLEEDFRRNSISGRFLE